MKDLLHFRLQCQDRHRLRHPINHVRDAQDSRSSLSVLGTPVKVWIRCRFLFGFVLVRVWGGRPESGSRWSARSAARTNDLEADEDPPHTRLARD